jgi:hypothetical protein
MPLRLDNAKGVARMPTAAATKNKPSSRDSRLTTRLCRCQKSDSQNASRPGRHQIGTVGEIVGIRKLPSYRAYVKLMIDGTPSKPFSARTLPPLLD